MNATPRTCHIVVGPPAAGKTSFAQSLCRERGAALVDIDLSTEPIVRAGMKALGQSPDDRDSPLFKSSFRDAIYETLFQIAAANLPHVDAVVVGPFTKELSNPRWLEELQQRLGGNCEVKAYYVRCDPDQRRQRMAQRGNPRDLAKLQSWQEHLSYYGDESPPAYPHVLVDTSRPAKGPA